VPQYTPYPQLKIENATILPRITSCNDLSMLHQTFDILIVALSRIVQCATTRQRPAKTAQCGRKTPQRHNPDNASVRLKALKIGWLAS
jgi:hypothetical protein